MSDNDDIIFAGRQYPFFSMNGLNLVKDLLLKRFYSPKDQTSFCDWTDPIIDSIVDSYSTEYTFLYRRKLFPIRDTIMSLSDEIITPSHPLFFNDLAESSFYRPHYTASNNHPFVA